MKLKSPKAKGDRYERDLASYFNEGLFGGRKQVSRAIMSGGGSMNYHAGGADLVGLPFWFAEAKHVNKINFRQALSQAERNAGIRETKDIPIVFSRIDREPISDSVVAFRLKNFLPLLRIQYLQEGIIRWDDIKDNDA